MNNIHVSCPVSAAYFSSFSVHALYIHLPRKEKSCWSSVVLWEKSQKDSVARPLHYRFLWGHQKSKGNVRGYHHSNIVTDWGNSKSGEGVYALSLLVNIGSHLTLPWRAVRQVQGLLQFQFGERWDLVKILFILAELLCTLPDYYRRLANKQ